MTDTNKQVRDLTPTFDKYLAKYRFTVIAMATIGAFLLGIALMGTLLNTLEIRYINAQKPAYSTLLPNTVKVSHQAFNSLANYLITNDQNLPLFIDGENLDTTCPDLANLRITSISQVYENIEDVSTNNPVYDVVAVASCRHSDNQIEDMEASARIYMQRNKLKFTVIDFNPIP